MRAFVGVLARYDVPVIGYSPEDLETEINF